MYKIDIPQTTSLETALESADWMNRYAELIKEHVTSPTTLVELPLPIFVLRSIAYTEKNLYFGNNDFIESLKDTAYIASTRVALRGRNGAVTRTFDDMFTKTEKRDLRAMVDELKRRISAHRGLLSRLQESQKQCSDSYNHLTKRKTILKSQGKRIVLLEKDDRMSDDVTTKWLTYKAKVQDAITTHETAISYFWETLSNERRARLDMEELQQEIHGFIRSNLEEGFRKSLETMATTIDLIDLDRNNERYQRTKSRIQAIDARDLAETFLWYCSDEYIYPNIDEFIRTTGFQETLPSGHMIGHTKLRTDDQFDEGLLLSSTDDDIGQDVPTMLDRNSNNGCYLRAIGSERSPAPEFLVLKKDAAFKQKLTVMNGEVVFGWSRKGRFGQKKWGFYADSLLSRV